ncbi:MAG: cytochrome c oxidase assembly protein [Hoeflea sp.]|uniref:cytochrome c oxidase assembly protein n=1 Tax=Hoeflea sp. TaxID=1940281 RepID=UPI001D97A3A9|nr:cytochrome c oxidase assembly protein [Hoeflea sp.]MBU4527739.1 cytochrome c oxidase assembly protein [Alphaproteobacteria bacterium]MBU4546226.1 cytochrome c oxidase assembly protein [Alphaproteobacteria bacterium]MBU4553089.1 cytochrome c oxidase assembly protein [Alphaproteobacteria bacterium]MBV1724161.1 cytochrome c oxidase assembly protein [Hoeflea sp.]MBV1759846.1 cytochrome c oxidase assembly protein [Hoeflea sp.]
MSDQQDKASKTAASANMRIVIACSAFVISMVGVSFAAVPLYQLFCQVTGYGGTTQRVEQMSDTILDRMIKVRFDANVAAGLPWKFRPVEREVELRIGETIQIAYTAENVSDVSTFGQATFNVTPMAAGAYFNKIQCFCFTETELKPGEIMNMPVVFFVDPAIVDDPDAKNITTITLSYTFFPHASEKPVAAMAEPVQDNNTL